MSGANDPEKRPGDGTPEPSLDDLELIPLVPASPLPPPTPPVEDAGRVDLAHYPRCPDCGYSLYGLPRLRCPECGASIRTEDLSFTDTRRAVERLARRERLCTRTGAALILLGVVLTFVVGRRHFPFNVCSVAPLVGLTLGVLLYRVGLGDAMPIALLSLGIVWTLTGVLFAWP